MQKAKRNGVRHKQDDNDIIQQNCNIKISEAHLAIEQLHEKLDRVSNKSVKDINTLSNELLGKSIMNETKAYILELIPLKAIAFSLFSLRVTPLLLHFWATPPDRHR